MEKLKMHSKDLSQDNLAKIQAAFPNCVTERKNAQGQIELAIDFDLLRQELSASIVEGPQERYRLDWPGKREAMLTANAPIAKTLRPAREESVNFDDTENLFIEGDNLDALKLLQETYLGKVKMIYIDPPYNTGNDFVYEDDFAENTEEFLQRSNQKDEQGNRLISNSESNGRFHSDWLSMMLSRLKLARNLLKDDGVIVISIDNNELTNCVKLCNEVFGEANCISIVSNSNNPKGRSDDKHIATAHEYLLFYAKELTNFHSYGFEPGNEILKRYNKIDSDGCQFREIDLRKTGDNDLKEDRPNLFYYFHYNQKTGEFFPTREKTPAEGFISIYPVRQDEREGNWRWGLDSAKKNIDKLIPKYMPNRKVWGVMEKDELANRTLVKPTSSWSFKDVNSERGSEEFIKLKFDKRSFPKPKPLGTVTRACAVCMEPKSDEIILDFFAGSSTTAHAVMKLNAEDGGNRKFIMVQLPEAVDEKHEAYKAGYKTIAEISKERIRRAGVQILEGECHEDWNKDIGFRVLKVDTSNMQDVYYQPQQLKQNDLFASVDNIKPDRSSEDLLFQVLLDWGVDLTLPIRRESIQGKEVFIVDDNALVACFEQGISEALIHELAELNPLRAVFRDNGFASDAVKVNVTQIFKQRSPITEVKAI